MWPRTEEERIRKRNCGFVSFMRRPDAEDAKVEPHKRIFYSCSGTPVDHILKIPKSLVIPILLHSRFYILIVGVQISKFSEAKYYAIPTNSKHKITSNDDSHILFPLVLLLDIAGIAGL